MLNIRTHHAVDRLTDVVGQLTAEVTSWGTNVSNYLVNLVQIVDSFAASIRDFVFLSRSLTYRKIWVTGARTEDRGILSPGHFLSGCVFFTTADMGDRKRGRKQTSLLASQLQMTER